MADFFAKGNKPINGYGGGNLASKSDLTSIFESGTTASQAISAGTYFYLDGTLVRAKTAIASGATFTLNTNYEVTTVGDAIKEVYDNTTTQIETRTIQLSANSEVTASPLSVSGSGEKTGSITITYRGFYFISVYKALLKITLNADVSVGYEGDDAYGLTSPPFFLEAGTYSYVYYGHDSGSAGYVRKVR